MNIDKVPSPVHNLPQALVAAADRSPGRGIALFDRRGRLAERRTYPELLATARRGAARLAARGVGAGDRVGVCLCTSWEWFEAWFGAALLGAWPLALAPPGPMGAPEATVARLDRLVERLGIAPLVCSASLAEEAARQGARHLAAAALAVEEFAGDPPVGGFPAADPDPGEVAYLQLTSGSTGEPRAVMVAHRGVLHNVRASDLGIGAPRGPASDWVESMVAWLPLYHDMGLVGCVLLSLVHGFDLWLLQPRSFLARPRAWLEELGRRGSAITAVPNFGLQLCLERAGEEGVAGLDLSRWGAAMVGAEMVRPETTAAFAATFGPCGFAAEAISPCYGLAEATLAVTFDMAGEGVRTREAPRSADSSDPAGSTGQVVCVGRPVVDTEVRVVGPDGAARPAGVEGEVWVRGPGVFAGYYRDAEATAEALRDGWLVTGDLGLIEGGELYLTGRLKDLLIIRGQNLMPHELEWIAESAAGAGGAARAGAFSVDRGAQGEQAVVVLEVDRRETAEAVADLDRRVRRAGGARPRVCRSPTSCSSAVARCPRPPAARCSVASCAVATWRASWNDSSPNRPLRSSRSRAVCCILLAASGARAAAAHRRRRVERRSLLRADCGDISIDAREGRWLLANRIGDGIGGVAGARG